MSTSRTAEEYNYLVDWSETEGAFKGRCTEFPGYVRTAGASHLALGKIREAVRELLENEQNTPEPMNPCLKGPKDSEQFLPVQDRTVSEAALVVAAQGDQARPTGPRENRQWLVTGRRANLIFNDLGNGWGSLDRLELKRGTTEEEFRQDADRLDVRSKNNPLDDITNPEQAYRDEYPGDLVPMNEREFPAGAVYFAAGGYLHKALPEAGDPNVQTTAGTVAQVVHTAQGYGWGRGRIHSVEPREGHTEEEFWSRLQQELEQ